MQPRPESPPWIATLPRDTHGYPVPAEVGWVAGLPVLRSVSVERKIVLGMRRRCAVCGYPLSQGRSVYRAFAQSDAAQMRMYEREFSNEWSGPTHLSCILYSAMVCPYLKEKQARLGKSNTINPGGRRGTRAAVMGFQDFGLMVAAQRQDFLDPGPRFAYLRLSDDIPYRSGSELRDRYEEAVSTDTPYVDTSIPRLFWTDSSADQVSLEAAVLAEFKAVKGSDPVRRVVLPAEGPFLIYEPRRDGV